MNTKPLLLSGAVELCVMLARLFRKLLWEGRRDRTCIGSLETSAKEDGSFEFAAVIPGLYQLKLIQVPELAPIALLVAGWDTTEVRVVLPAR